MSVAAPASAASTDPPSESAGTPLRDRPWRAHLTVALIALALAGYVTNWLWRDPYNHVLSDNVGDQAWFEWLLAYGVHIISHGGDPYFAEMMNAPHGVNLAANTSITVYTLLFAPLTYLAGPQVSFVTILSLNMAGTAFAWYLFLRRWLVRNPVAAGVAGLFCGFAPGVISHGNGHLNWTAGWIAPVVLWQVLKLRERGRWLRNGIVLGLLLTVGFSVAPEGLFFTALASGVFLGVWALAKPVRAEAREALPTVLAALGVTAVVAGSLLAYPLYMHFAGPLTFTGTGFDQRDFVEDPASYLSFASRSLAALFGLGSELASNRTEETSYFGVPLILLSFAALALLWRRAEPGRRATLRAVAMVGLVFMLISFGPRLNWMGTELNIPMPYAALSHLPLFDSALPTRFGLVLIGVIGILLALLLEQLLDRKFTSVTLKAALGAGVVVSLLPIFPLPLRYQERTPEPAFIANGTWKEYVSDNGVLTALPFALNVHADGQRWQSYTMARGEKPFRIPDGYFLGPQNYDEDGRHQPGRIGAPARATDWLFTRAAFYGYVAQLTNGDRAQARQDFQYWGVETVILADSVTGSDHHLPFREAVEITAIDLLGQPERVDDVLVWRIRPGVDPVDR
ncbi:DUF2079 domain-containing protein [Actinoplanes aureus]|uniref:DUF2079 domain-containing protein n=1 Tax=Actinoplanes aureus TaxID=2792083 RepID=A0A931CKV1_9ACTN|nr:DUF2079 domain-containing protein [Actinoplanes aureus]MBG0568113.1 DUF2079 domain-containing protein [Actinoplanes aureus]